MGVAPYAEVSRPCRICGVRVGRDALIAPTFMIDPETAGLPLLLYGHSMGAWAAAAVLGRTGAAGAVCVAGFDAPLDTVRFFMRRFGGAPALLGFPLVRLLGRLTFGRESNVSALRAVNATDKPVLIVHGSADDVVPDDISLFARAGELTNPNACALLVADEYRGTHSAAWLTREAARCLLAHRAELSACALRKSGANSFSGSTGDRSPASTRASCARCSAFSASRRKDRSFPPKGETKKDPPVPDKHGREYLLYGAIRRIRR